jgi:predicted DNA-binding ArsR family transcriptional regulator
VFLPILEKLRKPVMANQLPDELVAEFHQTSEKLVESFTTFIRSICRQLSRATVALILNIFKYSTGWGDESWTAFCGPAAAAVGGL